MKKIVFSLWLCIPMFCLGQVTPFPGLILNQHELLNDWSHDILNYGEIKTDGGLIYNTTGGHKHTESGTAITLTQGTTVSSDNGKTADFVIDSPYDLGWYHPQTSSPAEVLKNDYLEVGIRLDSVSEQMIQNFVQDLSGNKLNPYNPEEVDVKATFYKKDNAGQWQWNGQTFGFYYQDYQRNATDWTPIPTDHHMRMRFTPQSVGEYKCIIGVKINGGPEQFATHFHFTCVPSSLPGFVKVGQSKRYFTVNGEPFFPIGQNLPSPHGPAYGPALSSPNNYTDYYTDIQELKNAGGNYFRMLLERNSYEIEFEKINNYSDRLNRAWELDKMIQFCNTIDMRFHFNVMIHYPLENMGPFYFYTADWNGEDHPIFDQYPDCKRNPEIGYCYSTDLGLVDNRKFLTNEDARKHFRRKLRYIYSRWGYSPNVGGFELISEFNAIWSEFTGISYDDDGNCRPEHGTNPYFNDSMVADTVIRTKVADWQLDMASYIKDTLLHHNHTLNASFASNLFKLAKGDATVLSDDIDIISFNYYLMAPDKFYEMNSSTYESFNSPSTNSFYVNKPIINSESGPGDVGYCEGSTVWKKTVLLSPFTGFTGVFPWYNNNGNYMNGPDKTTRNNLWELFGNVHDFIGDIPLDAENWEANSFVSADSTFDVLFLRKGDGTEFIGAIHNRTWNFYTQKSPGDDTTACALEPNELDSFPDIYETPLSIISTQQNYANVFYTPQTANYRFEYYDPFTGNVIGDLVWDTFLDQYNLPKVRFGFPPLSGDGTRPIIFFHATMLPPGSSMATSTDQKEEISAEAFAKKINTLQDPLDEELKKQKISTEREIQTSLAGRIKVYPNPAEEHIQFSLLDEQPSVSGTWRIYSTSGKKVDEGGFTSNTFTYSTLKLAPGVYFVHFNTEAKQIQSKFIKL